MFARTMIAGAAVITLLAGATPAARAAEPNPAAKADAKAPAKPAPKSRKELRDPDGHKLSLDLDDGGKVVGTVALDAQGTALPVRELPVKDATVCIPGAKGTTLCQPLAALSDGTYLRMGGATCRCQVYSGRMYCYGDTCH